MEEEAKRRTLLRYIHAVKAAASLGLDDESHKSMAAAVGRPGRGIIQVRRGSGGGGRGGLRVLDGISKHEERNAHLRGDGGGMLPCVLQPALSIGTALIQAKTPLFKIF